MAVTDDLERTHERRAFHVLGGVITATTWFVLAATDLLPDTFLPLPSEVWRAAQRLWSDGTLQGDIGATTRALLSALAITAVLGLPVGVALGLTPRLLSSVRLLIGFGLTMPIVAFLSIFVLWFGFGFRSVVALGVVAGLLRLVLGVSLAVQGVSPVIRDVGRIYAGGRVRQTARVTLPAAAPTLLAATRLAAGLVLIGVIAGELFVSNEGLGARLQLTINFFNIAGFWAVLISIAVIAQCLMFGLSLIQRRLTHDG